jgi:hypothetical protein
MGQGGEMMRSIETHRFEHFFEKENSHWKKLFIAIFLLSVFPIKDLRAAQDSFLNGSKIYYLTNVLEIKTLEDFNPEESIDMMFFIANLHGHYQLIDFLSTFIDEKEISPSDILDVVSTYTFNHTELHDQPSVLITILAIDNQWPGYRGTLKTMRDAKD